jgi:hypothetical protein
VKPTKNLSCLILGLSLALPPTARGDESSATLSPREVSALVLALKRADRNDQNIGECRVEIEASDESIEVSFLSAAPSDLYHVGAEPPCDVSYLFDSSGKKFLRMYFNR